MALRQHPCLPQFPQERPTLMAKQTAGPWEGVRRERPAAILGIHRSLPGAGYSHSRSPTTVAAKTTTKHPQRPPCLSLPRVAGSSGGGEGSANRNGSLRRRSKHSAPGDPPRARPLALPSQLHLPGPPFAKPATHRPLHLCPPLSVARGFAYALQAQRRAQSAWHTASGQ